ncbi:MAG: BamA/TamA family outer membrane protein [Desulfobacteraceae bacterium]|nr:BamA/TamA family outer membrane protein [Desulfobacteraceae bacterium]
MLTRRPWFLYDGAYVPELLEEDTDAIASLYLTHGYMDTYPHPSVEWEEGPKNQKQAVIKLDIDEGIKTIVYSVNISGLSVLSLEEAYKAIQLKQGDPFRQYMVQSDVNALSSLISEKGYPHVEVKRVMSCSAMIKSCAEVNYIVNEGHYTEMGTVIYSGNFKTEERILNNELEMKPDEPFSLSKMMKTQQNFRNMDIFDSVQFKTQGLKEKENQVNLVVEVEEKKPFYVQTGIGYDTERNFYLQAKAGNRNFRGLNRNIWAEGEVSQIGHRADIGVTEPRLFGSRISSALTVFSERKEEFNQEFGISTHGASLGFNRKLSKYLNVGLSFRGEQRYQYLLDDDTVPENPEEYETRTLAAATPSISYDSRDSFFRPKKGIISSLSADISKGIDNTLDDFIKYRMDTRAFITPASFDRLTFAFRTQIGYIDPYNSDKQVPTDQLFFWAALRISGDSAKICSDTIPPANLWAEELRFWGASKPGGIWE